MRKESKKSKEEGVREEELERRKESKKKSQRG